MFLIEGTRQTLPLGVKTLHVRKKRKMTWLLRGSCSLVMCTLKYLLCFVTALVEKGTLFKLKGVHNTINQNLPDLFEKMIKEQIICKANI